MTSIYLDHNSTTPMLPEVVVAMADCYAAGYANPASQHVEGRRARRMLEEAREALLQFLGARTIGRNPDRLIFTSGGTEANNLAILGLARSAEAHAPGPHEAIVSAIEHPSVLGPFKSLEQSGWQIHRVPANQQGVVQCEQIISHVSDNTRLVSLMLGNNETGVLQPVTELARFCADRRVPLHVDATQVVGKLPVNFEALGVSTMAFAAHKFHGPLGTGALVVRTGVDLSPQLFGGFQQEELRPGTESIALAVGMSTAIELFARDPLVRSTRMRALRDQLEAAITKAYPRAIINGRDAQRLPGTSNIAFVDLDRQELLMALDLAGICCSTGSACASGSSEPSPVLLAMGLPAEIVNSSLRFSLGATTTEAEIDAAVTIIAEVCRRTAEKRRP